MNKEGLNPREQASSKRDRIEALACMGGAEAGNIRLSPTTSSKIQDPFHIWVALHVKDLISIFGLLQQPIQKRTISVNESPGERILIFGLCLCCNPKWASHIGAMLEADTVPFETNFEYGCTYGTTIGDSLKEQLSSCHLGQRPLFSLDSCSLV